MIQAVVHKKFVSMINASQVVIQTSNVENIKNVFKIHAMTPVVFANLITIANQVIHARVESALRNVELMQHVAKAKNVSMELVKKVVVKLIAQRDQHAFKVPVTLIVCQPNNAQCHIIVRNNT